MKTTPALLFGISGARHRSTSTHISRNRQDTRVLGMKSPVQRKDQNNQKEWKSNSPKIDISMASQFQLYDILAYHTKLQQFTLTQNFVYSLQTLKQKSTLKQRLTRLMISQETIGLQAGIKAQLLIQIGTNWTIFCVARYSVVLLFSIHGLIVSHGRDV